MEHGDENQKSQGHGPQEEDDLLHQEPCQDGKRTNVSFCRTQLTPATPRNPSALESDRHGFRSRLCHCLAVPP